MDKVGLHDLMAMKRQKKPIAMLTAYDYPTARWLDAAGIEMILVGDSLGMVVHGFNSTLPVTMDMMVLHCQAVMRGVERAFVVGDMPFGSYQVSMEDAKRNATRLMQEAQVDAVKLEGGERSAGIVAALVEMGIAVQGHIGLTPQSVSAFGGMKVQGKDIDRARQLIRDADALQAAGAFSIVLEAVPAKLATLISRRLTVPTIGIGAGPGCDGQVLVTHDLLGLFDKFVPKFVKQYAQVGTEIKEAVEAYRAEVRTGAFPTQDHSFRMDDDVLAELESEFGS